MFKKSILALALVAGFTSTVMSEERTRYVDTEAQQSYIGGMYNSFGMSYGIKLAVDDQHSLTVRLYDEVDGGGWVDDYNSYSISLGRIAEDHTLRVSHSSNTNNTRETSLWGSKTVSLSNIHLTGMAHMGHLSMDGYETVTGSVGGYALKNINDNFYATTFAHYGHLETIEGFPWSDDKSGRIGASVGYSADIYALSYSMADERIYGSNGFAHTVTADADFDNIRLSAWYYTTSQDFVEDKFGVGLFYKF